MSGSAPRPVQPAETPFHNSLLNVPLDELSRATLLDNVRSMQGFRPAPRSEGELAAEKYLALKQREATKAARRIPLCVLRAQRQRR